jgi:gluconokinase
MLQSFEPPHPTPLHYAAVPTPPISTPLSPSAASIAKPALEMTAPNHHHILIVTGPAGCGKSTVAKFLADRYGYEYIEGDDVRTKLLHCRPFY